MKKKFYITTPIYYPNDNLHIGHAYTTVLADFLARFKRMKDYEVFFLTGSDEHGQKIYDKAKEKKEDPLVFVTRIVDSFKDLWNKMGISYSKFIRTTDREHKEFVQKKFTELFNKNFIYKGKYFGFYCKIDETFFTKKQLINGKCPVCGAETDLISEETYFLKISEFKEWIKNVLKEENILIPNFRVKEMLKNFVYELEDLSVTRISFDWGIKIKEDFHHIVYVWLDALFNYLSIFSYSDSVWNIDEVWKENSSVEILHLVGKEIVRFHSIYWPIILKMLNYRKPKIFAHGWIITASGEKMSKSKGNVVDPLILIEKFNRDSLRFFLVNNIVTGEDGRFSEKLLIENINSILVNKFSNLIFRTDSMIKKYFNGVVPSQKKINTNEKILIKELFKFQKEYFEYVDNIKLSNAIKTLISYIEKLNHYIDISTPWKEKNIDRLSTIMNILVKEIHNLALLFSPLLIDSTEKIFIWLKTEKINFSNLNKDFSDTNLGNIGHLFERIK